MLQEVRNAVAASESGKPFSYRHADGWSGDYVITADPNRKAAHVSWRPNRDEALSGYFDKAQLDQIRELEAQNEDHLTWFKENEHLFLTLLPQPARR